MKPELCIATTDPVFVAALSAGVVAALGLSRSLARLERPVRGKLIPQQFKNLIWFGALAGILIGTTGLLNVLFQWVYPGMTLCTSLIGRWLLAPPIVLFVGGALWGVQERKRGADQGSLGGMAQ